ncbi:hypothetical protein QJQ45_008362 [Haematococcus lacustris]|nr:hypothetical protein QJQ45_008362 [Haematococcus lacustris]
MVAAETHIAAMRSIHQVISYRLLGHHGESRWRPLELCYWPAKGALPAKGKEYPGLGYKRLRDEPPKAQEQQPVVAQ